MTEADATFIPITGKLAAIGDGRPLPRIASADLGAAGGAVAPARVPAPPEPDELDDDTAGCARQHLMALGGVAARRAGERMGRRTSPWCWDG